ncbi:MAG: hypothetical protein GX811_11130, partial [Lentisphaerae bacterium]|nr:hypothetical protein [Lentisphaerota bacterium]
DIKGLSKAPEKREGYLIRSVTQNGKPLIVLKSYDRLGMLWAISSLNQMVFYKPGLPLVRAVDIEDYPRGTGRGYFVAIDQFFYPPAFVTWGRNKNKEEPDTDFLLRKERLFRTICKFNNVVYKKVVLVGQGSPESPEEGYWKYPEKWKSELKMPGVIEQLGSVMTPLGLDWYGCVHPDVGSPEYKMCADQETVDALYYYASKMEAAGGHLGIILDDVRFPLNPYDEQNFGSAREADTWIITHLMSKLKPRYPGAKLMVCPPFYWGPVGSGWRAYGEDRDAYLKAIGERWPKEVGVCWTGQQVNGTPLAKKEYTEWITGLIGRKPWLWQNNAITWYSAYFFHYGAEPITNFKNLYWDGFLESLDYYGLNSDFAVRSIANLVSADFCWNPEAYDAEESVKEAAGKLIGPELWPTLQEFTNKLQFFDRFASSKNYGWLINGPFRDDLDEMNKYGALNIDILQSKLADVGKSYDKMLEANKPAVLGWTGSRRFYEIPTSIVGRIARDKNLAVYRTAADQRSRARVARDYGSEKDYFFPSVIFERGDHVETSLNLAQPSAQGKNMTPAIVANSKRPIVEAKQWIWKNDIDASYQLRICARKGPGMWNMVIHVNSAEVCNTQMPFDERKFSSVQIDLPKGILVEKDNRIAIRISSVTGKPGADEEKYPPLTLQYAVLKRVGR